VLWPVPSAAGPCCRRGDGETLLRRVIGSSAPPYINSLASASATFTASTAITHPSEPNYLALYSGSTQGQPWQGLTVKEHAPKIGYADLRVAVCPGGSSGSDCVGVHQFPGAVFPDDPRCLDQAPPSGSASMPPPSARGLSLGSRMALNCNTVDPLRPQQDCHPVG
jgi:hypothetical protein